MWHCSIQLKICCHLYLYSSLELRTWQLDCDLFSDGQVDAAQTLPDVILGNYTLTYTSSGITGRIENNTLDTCTQKNLMQFTDSGSTEKLAYSGKLSLFPCKPPFFRHVSVKTFALWVWIPTSDGKSKQTHSNRIYFIKIANVCVSFLLW